MKKRSIWRIAALVLCIAMAMGIVILRNRKETVTVQEKYHERDEACDASFMMWSMERDGIQYGFDQKGFTKEEAISYMLEVEGSVDTIRTQMKDVDSFPQDMEMQILVLNDTSTVALAGSEEVLVLGKAELEMGEYRFPLFLSICRIPENSHSFGAYEYVFGINYNNDEIKEYLSREENLPVLNLFYPRLSEKYSDKEDAEMFAQILASFATETIQETGLEHYLGEPATEKAVNDWLRKIGSDIRYVDGSLNYMNQLEFHGDNTYDLNITCGNVTYLSKNLKSAFDSVSELEDMIVWEIKTRDALEQYLKENSASSPMFDPAFRLTYDFVADTSGISFTYSKDNSAEICFYRIFKEALTHELAHAFVGTVNPDKRWMNEGVAEFLAMAVFSWPSKDAYCNEIRNRADTGSLYIDNYIKIEGVPEDIEDVNMSTVIDANVYAYWCGDDELQFSKIAKTLSELGAAGSSDPGGELSYWEAESFVAYLIENYSFEDTWNCMTSDLSFEEVYGKPYNLLKKDWTLNIRKKFS